jgi:hypothetical protein
VCKRLGISDQTFLRWRIKYGALKEAATWAFPSQLQQAGGSSAGGGGDERERAANVAGVVSRRRRAVTLPLQDRYRI